MGKGFQQEHWSLAIVAINLLKCKYEECARAPRVFVRYISQLMPVITNVRLLILYPLLSYSPVSFRVYIV